ncbi:MAG TPA: hypothetical protein PLX89_19150 [Verrucomicrobiota bacterium]|nr:hypothetical protein [Verrucomicrobiota bacterium]
MRLLPGLLRAACLILLFASPSHAQETDVKISKEQLEALQQKAAEVERLQEQLNQAQRELQALKATNAVAVPVVRDSDNRVVPLPLAVLQAMTNQPPTPPLVQIPPVTPDTVINVQDLLTYFETDPAAANARFKNQTFSIRGIATDFRKPMFLSTYDVNFRLPGHELHVYCLFRPPDEFNRVYISRSGEEIIGHTYNAKTVFARAGAELTIRGYCEGVKDKAVRMGGCQYLVSPSSLSVLPSPK